MRKPIEIEKLIVWAFREELPKAGAARSLAGVGIKRAYRAVEKFAEYLTLIDCEGENRFGVVSDLMAMNEPHPDAVRVYEAVQRLDAIELELPDDWNPLSDLAGIEPELPELLARALDKVTTLEADGWRTMKRRPSSLIAKHAILGGAPVWEADQPERKLVLGPKGQPAWFRRIVIETSAGPMDSEVDGYDPKRKRPMAGAYRKTYLDPDPLDAAIGRAEYEVWHSALGFLVEELADELEDFSVLPSPRPERPWEVAPAIAPQILPNLIAPVLERPKARGWRRKARVS